MSTAGTGWLLQHLSSVPSSAQLLRVEHPAAKYTKVHGGAVEVENEPHKIKFFDRERGECT